MTTNFRTLLFLGFTALAGAASGCIVESSSHGPVGGGPTCLDNQYFLVRWGVDHGPGTIPLSCGELSSRGLSVVLSTTAGPPYDVLQAAFNVACIDGRVCDGLPCNAEGSTNSAVPVGTEVIAADVIDRNGNSLNTAEAPVGYPIVSCNYRPVGYAFEVP